MTPFQKDWLQALRSGDYKQGRGRLRQGDAFCCLGVACDVSKLGEWQGCLTDPFAFYVIDNQKPCSDIPPTQISNALGLDAQMPTKLAEMNDDLNFTFPQIADVLEAYFDPEAHPVAEFQSIENWGLTTRFVYARAGNQVEI